MRNAATIVLVFAVAVAGCSFGFKRDETQIAMEPAQQATYLEKSAVTEDSRPQPPTAVENALAWSEKYARAVEDLSRRQEENRKLADEKRELAEQHTAIQSELTRTQKELKEANDLLIEVRRQNEKWKANVLGYRDEMRAAHKTELDALVKVLRLLGGEFSKPTDTSSTQAPAAEKDRTAKETKGADGESAG